MTESTNASNGRKLTLLPDNFSNEIFEQNLAYLKSYQPALYKAVSKYKCKEYRLCSNPDGSPNIFHMPSQKPVYYASSMDEIMAPINQQIEQLFCYTMMDGAFFNAYDDFYRNNNPIHIKMMQGLYDAGIFHDMQLGAKMMDPVRNYSTDYLPLVRVYGIGLGYHLTELLKRKKISYMMIYEPHFDLFYLSLFTIPWNLIFKYFEYNNKGINLVLDSTPDEAIRSNLGFIEQRLTPLTTLFYRFNHFKGLPVIQELIEKEPQADNTHRHNFDAGWYEDQRSGFYYAARNIKEGKRFFSGKKIKRYLRVFIVGSGPSLNESINYIKAHKEDAIVLSCGSAIAPLLDSGIVPDYQVVQERYWHTAQYEEGYDQNLLKDVSLLKLNVVSPRMDKYYKETLIFQKYRDPGSALLQRNYPVTMHVNPTVTNAGIAFATELGANEVYLFGVDYGAPKGSERMHADNTLYDDSEVDDAVEKDAAFELKGNLGAIISSSHTLTWSLKVAEERVSIYPNIKWFNVGEGAFIKGVSPMPVEKLPVQFDKSVQKHKLSEEIRSCFDNNYSYEDMFAHLNTHHMQQVEGYFQALLGFTDSRPQSREEIVSTLSLMYKAASIGAGEVDYLPALLLSPGIKQYITNVYIQNGLAVDDESAARFFEAAKIVFTEHIDDIKKDLERILSYIEGEEEAEIVRY